MLKAPAKISPFKYINAIRICDNDKSSISRSELHEFIRKGILSRGHIELIKLLYKYKYLSTKEMEDLYGAPIIKDISGFTECTIEEAISFMFKKGIILRHYYSKMILKGDAEVEKRSINFYTLSLGTCIYLNKDMNYTFIPEEYLIFDEPYKIFERLSINALAAKYSNHSRSQHVSIEVQKPAYSPFYNKNFFIDAYIKCILSNTVKYFAVYSIRRNENWQQELELKLKLLKDYLLYQYSLNTILEAPIVLLVCEDDMHMSIVYEFIDMLNLNFSYCYTTDTRQFNEITHENLILVDKENIDNKVQKLFKEYKSPLLI